MSADLIFKGLEEHLNKTLEHLRGEFSSLQMGRASAALVERIQVDVYGTMQPLKAVASISVPDAKTIQIQPWDRGTLQAIEKSIMLAELGLTPQNDGIVIRLNIPAMTEDRRRDLSKVVNKMAEESKIAVRNARHEALDKIKTMQKNSQISEDQLKGWEKKIQEKIDQINRDIDHSAKEKEADIMKV